MTLEQQGAVWGVLIAFGVLILVGWFKGGKGA